MFLNKQLTALLLATLCLTSTSTFAQVGTGRTPAEIYEQLQETYSFNKTEDSQEEQKQFIVHDDFEINLFAESPDIVNPIAMKWDAQGRLWVINSPMYPHVLPGQKQTDFISVLEDTDNDGKADKSTVFYDKLYVPTGLALGDGGVYVANQPDLLFLKDTDGDLVADTERVLLSGFGTEDNHHAISAFTWGPGGWLYFQSGVFLHTQVETPHGLLRLDNGGVFQLRPRELKLKMFNVGSATNPWGHTFNKWGQSFLTEGPQGGIWFLTPATSAGRPSERVPGTKAPKSCGTEFIYNSHFSDKYQNRMVLNAFKNKTVNLYEFSDDGAGYATKELQPHIIVSKGSTFRPVDVKTGPDGALYIADFHQTVIGHMQFQFRDDRRDHLNGRIWRLTQKGRDTLKKIDFTKLSVNELFENLKSVDSYNRDKSRRELYERDQAEVITGIKTYLSGLNTEDANYEQHRLEALWVSQTINHVDLELLQQVLNSPKGEARAAATRVLRYWQADATDSLVWLDKLIEDKFPRVRLEALCALSYFDDPQAVEIAAKASDHPSDKYLDYTFKHTIRNTKKTWLPALKEGQLTFNGNLDHLQAVLSVANASEATSLLLNILKEGKLDRSKRLNLLTVVASQGTAAELGELFSPNSLKEIANAGLAENESLYTPALHAQVLKQIVYAFRTRKITPAGNLADIAPLLESSHSGLVSQTLELIGLWNLAELRPQAESIALNKSNPTSQRQAAFTTAAKLGGESAQTLLKQIATSNEEQLEIRYRATAALVDLDVNAAATQAVTLLQQAPEKVDPALLIGNFFSVKNGPDQLVTALKDQPTNTDAAKLALRYMNATGKQHPQLVETFRALIGTGSLTKELMSEDLTTLLKTIQTEGDAHRGEEVFRRKDLACFSCHAIAGGGAPVGPDLEGLGASSPLDYVFHAIVNPNKAVREGYAAVTLLTEEGKVVTGILKEKTPEKIVILDASTRKLRTFNPDEIDEVLPAPSMMPKGLVDNMTRQEFLDLARFIHELGRPGPFATPNIPIQRTWRQLVAPQTDLSELTAHEVEELVAKNENILWSPIYSRVTGALYMQDLNESTTTFLTSKLELGTPGKINLNFNSVLGLTVWFDGEPITDLQKETLIETTTGQHTVTYRVDRTIRGTAPLRLELEEAANSPARPTIINGL